jgi:T1SS-143 domain-containing protein
MRYDDASQAGSMANDDHSPVARPDVDALAPNNFGPATGNVITGAGTTTGPSGADSVGDAPGLIVAVQGAGGPASNADGSFQANGQFGVLSMDAQGNFNYVRNAGTPDGVQDVFNYTLADRDGQTSSTTLAFDIAKGGVGQAAVVPGTAPVIPGVVNLPAGVQMSDIHVVGRDLVINMPDGTQMVIPNGAVFVPQLVIGDVQLPPSNLAALLVESEPQPAAGALQSSGGNFATDVPPLDPGVPLGDLIPPTELNFPPPTTIPVGQFEDLKPEAGTISVQLDDDALQGGNAGGVGDDPDSVNATGNLPGSGGDQPIHFDLLTDGAPAGFSYVDGPNGSILVQQVQNGSTVTVLTITVDAATGAYTVTENAPIMHPAGGDENNVSFVINYTVIDNNGDTAAGTLNINVDDDTPVVHVIAGPDADVVLTTHDASTIGANSDTAVTTANFSGVFAGTTVSFGADGAGPGTSSTYTLAVTGSNSGLTSHGATINLFVVNGVVVGTTAASAGAIDGSNTIFTVSTTNTGIVTLTQFQQIDHPIGQDPSATGAPFADQLISMSDGLVTLTRSETVVDGDGDQVTGSATVSIGANLHFTDDGPTLSLADRGEATLSVDESNLAVNDTQSFAANFSANFGADGPAAAGGGITYALGINAGATGLIDTLTHEAVVLSVVNGQVVGTAGVGGPIVFTVSVDASGNVTLDQQRAVIHSPDSGPDQTTTLAADNLVTLTATATDFDGDTARQTLNLGLNLTFHDDAPSATATLLTGVVDEDGVPGGIPGGTGDVAGENTVATGNVSTLFNSGADAPLSFHLLGDTSGLPALTSGGLQVNYQVVGNTLTASTSAGTVFTFVLNADGSYTFTLADQLDHPAGNNENDLSIALGSIIQATDADGDSVTANANGLVITVDDDTPVANNDTDTLPSGSNGPETGNVITGAGTAGGLGGAGADSSGADAPAHITALAGAGGTDTTFSGGFLSITGDHGTLIMDANGNYSYTRTDNVPGILTDTFTYTLTDADGDSTTATLTINLSDNVPTLPDPTLVRLDDDALSGGNPGGTGDDADSAGLPGQLNGTGGDGTLTYSFTGTNTLPAGFTVNPVNSTTVQILQGGTVVLTVTLNTSTGAFNVVQNNPIDHPAGGDENNVAFSIGVQVTDADGDSDPANITINVDDDTPVAHNDTDSIASGGTTATGNVITGVGTTSGVAGADSGGADAPATITAIQGTAGTDTTFSSGVLSIGGDHGILQMDANGNYTYTRTDNVPGNLTDTFTYTLTDADGDSVTATLTISMSDSVPTAGSVSVGLDDDALAGGNPGGVGDDPNSVNATGTLPGSGGDGTLTFGVQLTGAPAGFTYVSGGAGVVLVQQGGVTVLTVTVGTNGSYSVVQNAPIDHAAGGDENNQNFTITYTVTDQDGDPASPPGTINISVDDDTPTVSSNAAVQLDDDALTGGNAGGIGDDPNAVNTSGTLAHSFGADGAGTIAYLTNGTLPAGFSFSLQGNGDLWIMQGATHVLTLTVNATSGAYTVTQVAPISHPAGGDENNVSFTVNYQVTDGDGDTATGSIVVNVDDDTPTATIVTTGQHVALDESAGNQGDSNDVTGPLAAFAGVTNVGDDPDVAGTGPIQFATNASAIVASTGSSYGADGAGTTAFSLSLSASGVDSGLNTTSGQDIFLFVENGIVVGRVGNASGPAAFAISIDQTGHLSMVEYLSIQHPDATNPDDMVSITNGAILATVTVTDADGDSATNSTPIGSLIQFQDSGPVMTAASDINIQNTGDVANTGAFAFNLGADGAPTSNDVIKTVVGSATVAGNPVQNFTLTAGTETATTASYTFSFDYDTGNGGLAHETGTLTFNKAAGTYTVDLDNPIQAFSTLQTAEGTAFVGYEFNTSTTDHTSPVIAVTTILDESAPGANDGFFVQFTGFGAGNGSHETIGDGTANTFVNGDLFSEGTGSDALHSPGDWVSVSNSSNGVGGDTINGPDAINFNLYSSNPTGLFTNPTGNLPTASASDMFLRFDGVAAGDDMIVVLKLWSDSNHNGQIDASDTFTTKAIVVEAGDMYLFGGSGAGSQEAATLAALTGTPYEAIAAGIVAEGGSNNNDGLVIIESNDYNAAGENYQIVGAEIINAALGVTGTGINLDPDVGSGGGSSASQSLSVVDDGAPMKITNIGFIAGATVDQTAHLTFDVTIQDGDGDTVTQTINADVTAAADSSTPISLGSGVTTISQTPLSTKSSVSTLDTQQTTTNSNSILMGALAAAGLAASEPLAAHSVSDQSRASNGLDVAGQHTEAFAPVAADAVSGNHGLDLAAIASDGRSADAGVQSSGAHGDEGNFSARSVDDGGVQSEGHAPSALSQGTDAPGGHDAPAALTATGIAMPDAALLAAAHAHAGVAGQAQSVNAQHNEVVGQVLADALHGGGNGPNVDALVNSLPQTADHGQAAADALASHAGAAVPNGDMGVFAGFTGAGGLHMMHQMAVHADAVPAHA